jgi:D-cysteine desulfhydrase
MMSERLDSLPRRALGFLPTPLHELPRLSEELGGPRLWMKRDDLTGLALGGNKTRKLELLLGDALAQGCDCVITGGAEQSNHSRQTAAAAAMAGLECHLALGGEAPALFEGNLLLDQLCGAQLHWCGEHRKGERIPAIAEELRRQGRRPYLVPYGGSNRVGAAAFVRALRELVDQSRTLGVQPSQVVFASSSGGTHAGLVLGARAFAPELQAIGVEIEKEGAGEVPVAQLVLDLARETAEWLALRVEVSREHVELLGDYLGGGYGVVGDLEREAIATVARAEGIILDPVYTGRAMGGLLDQIRRGRFTKDDTVVFWHTGGARTTQHRAVTSARGRRHRRQDDRDGHRPSDWRILA